VSTQNKTKQNNEDGKPDYKWKTTCNFYSLFLRGCCISLFGLLKISVILVLLQNDTLFCTSERGSINISSTDFTSVFHHKLGVRWFQFRRITSRLISLRDNSANSLESAMNLHSYAEIGQHMQMYVMYYSTNGGDSPAALRSSSLLFSLLNK
jgi:hypothetical protein